MLFTRPFQPIRRWNADGEIAIGEPSPADLPQWPRDLFHADANCSSGGAQESPSSNLSISPYELGRHSLSPTVQYLCDEGIILTSNLERLLTLLLYRSIFEDQDSGSTICLQSEVFDKLNIDQGLETLTKHTLRLLQWKDMLARSNHANCSTQEILRRLDRRWLTISRLCGIISMIAYFHMPFDGDAAAFHVLRQTVAAIQRSDNPQSTWERLTSVLSSSSADHESLADLGGSYFDAQVSFAIASGLMVQKRFSDAYSLWSTLVEYLETPDTCNHTLAFLAVMELVKCCNILNRAPKAEEVASDAIERYSRLWGVESICDLQISLVDSMIGQKNYGQARKILVTAMQSHHMSSYTRHIACLRFNKIQRRLGAVRTLEFFLGIGKVDADPLDSVTATFLEHEYLEELSASLSCPDVEQMLEKTSENSLKLIRHTLADPTIRKHHKSSRVVANSLFKEIDAIAKQNKNDLPNASPDGVEAEAQQLPRIKYSSYEAGSSELDTIRQRHYGVYSPTGTAPRTPVVEDFERSLSFDIYPSEPSEQRGNVVVLISDFDRSQQVPDTSRLKTLALDIRRRQPRTNVVILWCVDPKATGHPELRFNFASDFHELLVVSECILTSLVKYTLISRCGFGPRDIVLIGCGQGGTTCLTIAAIWQDIELGGVVSIEGLPPSFLFPDQSMTRKIKTLAFTVTSGAESLGFLATDPIQSKFEILENRTIAGTYRALLDSSETNESIFDFLDHRLYREEWKSRAILSFDNGYIGNYGSLLILQALMDEIEHEECRLTGIQSDVHTASSNSTPSYNESSSFGLDAPRRRNVQPLFKSTSCLPCQYFDCVGGVSSGGLVAIMISRLRMNVEDCLKEYKELCKTIYGFRPKNSGWASEASKAAIHSLIIRNQNNNGTKALQAAFWSDEDLCRTLVVLAGVEKHLGHYMSRSFYSGQQEGYRFLERNTKHDSSSKVSLEEVARVSVLGPRNSSQVTTEGNMESPPVEEAGLFHDVSTHYEPIYGKLSQLWQTSDQIKIFTGIGAESSERRGYRFGKAMRSLVKYPLVPGRLRAALRPEQAIRDEFDRDQVPYYRLHGGGHLESLPLFIYNERTVASRNTFDAIAVAISSYLSQSEVQQELKECATILVKRRRLRARDPSAWDRYAWASYYECSYTGCPSEQSRWNTADLFKDHVLQEHYSALTERPLEQALKEDRRCWEYPKKNSPPPQNSVGSTP
ncbi:MAG: hypothetical protein Q9168_005383 [Polycauliona sp. 1 TL-2023]